MYEAVKMSDIGLKYGQNSPCARAMSAAPIPPR